MTRVVEACDAQRSAAGRRQLSWLLLTDSCKLSWLLLMLLELLQVLLLQQLWMQLPRRIRHSWRWRRGRNS